jgi:hypothetical protein
MKYIVLVVSAVCILLVSVSVSRGINIHPFWMNMDVATGDLDGDGFTDVVTTRAYIQAGPHVGRVAVYRRDPMKPGTFLKPELYKTGVDSRAVVISDLDGNGSPDILVANYESKNLTILLQQDQVFPVSIDIPLLGKPNDMAVGDIDGDGRQDIAVAIGKTVQVLLQTDGPPISFMAPQTYLMGAFVGTVTFSDLNGDGRLEMIVGSSDTWKYGQITIFLQTPSNPGTFGAPIDIDIQPHTFFIDARDIDGDEKPDLAVALYGQTKRQNGGVGILMQKGAWPGAFPDRTIYCKKQKYLSWLRIEDMDRDFSPDIAIMGPKGVAVLRQDPARKGTFFPPKWRKVPQIHDWSSAGLGDFNGDGFLDFVVLGNDLDSLKPLIVYQDPKKPGSFLRPQRMLISDE